MHTRPTRKLAQLSDVVPPSGAGDDGNACRFVFSGDNYVFNVPDSGGGTSDHAALSHLDYAAAGHTDFAGTKVQNTFMRQQSIIPSIDDAVLGAELLVDGNFPDLTNWTDDASGWSVAGGLLSHAPGTPGTLTQNVSPAVGTIYVIEATITGMTTGRVQIYDNYNLYITATDTDNGVKKSIGYVFDDPDPIVISADDLFDGTVSNVSLKPVTANAYPASIVFYDVFGNIVSEIRTFNGSFFFGLNSGRHSNNNTNVAMGNYALDAIDDSHAVNAALGQYAGHGAKTTGGVYLGPYTGVNETVDYRFHAGNDGDLISGQMNHGDAATQSIKFHAATINVADIPTSSAGLSTGDIWNDGGVLKVA